MTAIQLSPLATTSFSFYSPPMGVPVSTAVKTPAWMPGIDFITPLKPLGIFGKPQFRHEADYIVAYLQRLDHLETEIQKDLERVSLKHGGATLVLMCWCNVQKGEWCHRRMFADWIIPKIGVDVPELGRAPRVGAKPKPDVIIPAPAIEPLF